MKASQEMYARCKSSGAFARWRVAFDLCQCHQRRQSFLPLTCERTRCLAGWWRHREHSPRVCPVTWYMRISRPVISRKKNAKSESCSVWYCTIWIITGMCRQILLKLTSLHTRTMVPAPENRIYTNKKCNGNSSTVIELLHAYRWTIRSTRLNIHLKERLSNLVAISFYVFYTHKRSQ